jgi:transcriptional regulator with XRE-family HTH domain
VFVVVDERELLDDLQAARIENLGRLLRRRRYAAGLTQEELAARAAVSARTISDVERGLREGVYRETAARIAAGLGLAGGGSCTFRGGCAASAAPARPAASKQLETDGRSSGSTDRSDRAGAGTRGDLVQP